MLLYSFICTECGHIFDKVVAFGLQHVCCVKCGGKVDKVISPVPAYMKPNKI